MKENNNKMFKKTQKKSKERLIATTSNNNDSIKPNRKIRKTRRQMGSESTIWRLQMTNDDLDMTKEKNWISLNHNTKYCHED